MADVQFSDEQTYARPAARATHSPLIRLVIKSGLAKDQQQAEYVLIGVGIAAVLLAAAIWLFTGTTSSEPVPGPLEQALVPGQRQPITPSR